VAVISEIAPNVFRISIFAQVANLQFNHFLVKDDEPLLYHTGCADSRARLRQRQRGDEAKPVCINLPVSPTRKANHL